MTNKNRSPRGRALAVTGLVLVTAVGASLAGVTAAHAEDGPVVTRTGTSSDPDPDIRTVKANNSASHQAYQACKDMGYETYRNPTTDDDTVTDDGTTATVTYVVTCTR